MEKPKGSSATGRNAPPDRAGEPDSESSDAVMGTTSGRGPDFGKRGHQGKPAPGSLDDADSQS